MKIEEIVAALSSWITFKVIDEYNARALDCAPEPGDYPGEDELEDAYERILADVEKELPPDWGAEWREEDIVIFRCRRH